MLNKIFLLACVPVFAACAGMSKHAAVPYDQLKRIEVTDRDCHRIDQAVDFFERQTRLRGTHGQAPEALSDEDRAYNATARIAVWALRVGCNNPNRYVKPVRKPPSQPIRAVGPTANVCYFRNQTDLTREKITGEPTDIQYIITPDPANVKCVARYRLLVNGTWVTAEGTGTGVDDGTACGLAMQRSRGHILMDMDPKAVESQSQMVCSSMPDIRVRPVRAGELIWESEADWPVHPDEQGYFNYKRTVCRKFNERATRNQNLVIYQGIICRENSGQWRVIDKY